VGRTLRIGIYSPFFGSTIGGGEKYLGVTAEALRDAFPNASIEIMSPVPADPQRYEAMLGLDLRGITFRSTNAKPSRLKRALASVPKLRLYRDLFVSAQAVRATADYDLLISMVYVLPAFNRARRGVILCQFPYERSVSLRRSGLMSLAHRLYALPYQGIRRRLFGAEVDDFELVICQSEYVRRWIRELWDRDSEVVNPPIDVPPEEPAWAAKQRMIVSVGRFFAGGHSKRHDLMVQAFREICDEGHSDWELHLAGSVHRDRAADLDCFEHVLRLAQGYPVHIHADATLETIEDLYRSGSIYWHAAGYGANAERAPAALEHFGMTTAEAMGHGAVPIAIGRGGQVEVVHDGLDGFLWKSIEELKARTLELMGDPTLRLHMGLRAHRAVSRFSRGEFKRRMAASVEPIIRELERELDQAATAQAPPS
jgi:glycosyltransferase involved in cell wall biosynthesis